jgi:hypothetical protein
MCFSIRQELEAKVGRPGDHPAILDLLNDALGE